MDCNQHLKVTDVGSMGGPAVGGMVWGKSTDCGARQRWDAACPTAACPRAGHVAFPDSVSSSVQGFCEDQVR